MTAFRSVRRRRTLSALLIGLVGLIALPSLGFASYRLITTSTEGDFVTVICRQSIPRTPALLLAVTDDAGRASSVAMMTMKPEANGAWGGGTIVSVPPSARVVYADGSIKPLSESTMDGDPLALLDAFVSLTGVSPSAGVIVDSERFVEMFEPIGDVSVDAQVMRLLVAEDERGGLAESGPVVVGPRELALLFGRIGETAEPLVEVELADTLWRAVATKVGFGLRFPGYAAPSQPPTTETVAPLTEDGCPARSQGIDDPLDAATFVAAMMSAAVGTYRINGTIAEGNDELVLYDIVESQFIMARLAPSLVSPALEGPTVFLVSALSDEATKEAIARLSFLQLNIRLRSQPDAAPPAVTTMAFEDDSRRRALEGAVAHIGPYRVVEPTSAWEGIDVVITLGISVNQHFASGAAPAAATDTSTPVTPVTGG